MIRFRLAQSNAWVYSIQHVEKEDSLGRNIKLLRQCELELQAWVMKMAPEREEVPEVVCSEFYDYRNRTWIVGASWLSPRRIHEVVEEKP